MLNTSCIRGTMVEANMELLRFLRSVVMTDRKRAMESFGIGQALADAVARLDDAEIERACTMIGGRLFLPSIDADVLRHALTVEAAAPVSDDTMAAMNLSFLQAMHNAILVDKRYAVQRLRLSPSLANEIEILNHKDLVRLARNVEHPAFYPAVTASALSLAAAAEKVVKDQSAFLLAAILNSNYEEAAA